MMMMMLTITETIMTVLCSILDSGSSPCMPNLALRCCVSGAQSFRLSLQCALLRPPAVLFDSTAGCECDQAKQLLLADDLFDCLSAAQIRRMLPVLGFRVLLQVALACPGVEEKPSHQGAKATSTHPLKIEVPSSKDL